MFFLHLSLTSFHLILKAFITEEYFDLRERIFCRLDSCETNPIKSCNQGNSIFEKTVDRIFKSTCPTIKRTGEHFHIQGICVSTNCNAKMVKNRAICLVAAIVSSKHVQRLKGRASLQAAHTICVSTLCDAQMIKIRANRLFAATHFHKDRSAAEISASAYFTQLSFITETKN